MRAAVDYYVARNGLRAYPDRRSEGKVKIEDYDVPRDSERTDKPLPVRVLTLDGGGHAWPGSTAERRLADKPFPFDGSRAILAFFGELATASAPAATPR